MAGKGQLSHASFSKSFEEQFDHQLTCSVCLERYTNPKTLPCHHSFCLHCIEPLPVEIKDEKCYIRCPTCRVDHLLPQGGANSLPNDFKINSLLDLRKKLETTKAAIPLAATSTQLTCPKHNDFLIVYCETCCQVICRICTISTEHNEHTFYLISECYPKHHQQIQDNLDLVKHKLADMNTAMTHLDTRDRKVVKQGENVKEEINTHAQQLIDNIQQSRIQLTQQVDTIVQRKRSVLARQKLQAQKIHTQLKTCQDKIEHSLKEWNEQKIVTQKSTLMEKMNTATQHIDPAVFRPIEDANIQCSKEEKEMGSITGTFYGKATLGLSQCTLPKQPSTATLILHSQDGSPFSLPPSLISSTLSSPGDTHSVKCPITQTKLGEYSITFTPSTRNDQLVVQVGGVDVPDSPFCLQVIPKMRGEPVNIITGLSQPSGIAVCDNGDILVAEFSAHCVSILSKTGDTLKTLKQFNFPRGVAISIDGHILVTDNHRLQKLTTDGVCVKSVGSNKSGRGQLHFTYPQGIAIHPTTGQIFVADFGNYRIQVFSNDLTFSHTITSNSTRRLPFLSPQSAQFSGPRNIALDKQGYLYIADNDNHCIFKLSSSTGKYINRFGSTPDQKVINPSSLTIHNNQVYVSQSGHDSLLVFDTEGKFLHQLRVYTTRGLKNPECISTDACSNLFICDTGNNRILTQKIIMMDEMNTDTQHANPTVFQPIEDINIELLDTSEKEMGAIARKASLDKSSLEASSCVGKQPASTTTLLHAEHTLSEGHSTKIIEESEATIEKLRIAHHDEVKSHNSTKEELDECRRKMERVLELARKSEQSWRISNKDIQITPEELGKGGWGTVAVGVFREQKVAVKQLPVYNIIKSDHNLAIMNREIDTMSRLRHPNLLLFIGAVLDHPSGNPLIITEIMDTSLRQGYEKGWLTNDETSKLSILRDTASGLNYLHCHHDEIIHHDVSSANVLLESRGVKKWRAKLSDFGSANIARQAYTQQMGAAVYSAPEAMVALGDDQEQQQTTKMDVYSYGILSCEVLCCQFPESRSVFQTMLSRVRNISPSIAQMIKDCMNKSPQQRPSMVYVIHSLDNML